MNQQDSGRLPRRDIKVSIHIKSLVGDGQGDHTHKLTPSHLSTINISLQGLGLFSDTRLEKDARLLLEMDGRPLGLPHTFTFSGEVRYCIAFEEVLYRCGIRFVNLPDAIRHKVEAYITAA